MLLIFKHWLIFGNKVPPPSMSSFLILCWRDLARQDCDWNCDDKLMDNHIISYTMQFYTFNEYCILMSHDTANYVTLLNIRWWYQWPYHNNSQVIKLKVNTQKLARIFNFDKFAMLTVFSFSLTHKCKFGLHSNSKYIDIIVYWLSNWDICHTRQ